MEKEVRVLLQRRIEFQGDINEIISALSFVALQHKDYTRVCVEHNPGYDRGGWNELVGYRPLNEKEIAAKKRLHEDNKKRMRKRIREKEQELKGLKKKLKDMG